MSGAPDFLTPVTLSPADFAEALAAQMADAWRRGECLPAEHYLQRHPDLLDQPEAAVRVVYEEVCLRQERGEQVGAEELSSRFPDWAAELGLMLDCDRLVVQRLAPRFPEVGETLGEFVLTAELGRGAHGRVFLATQPALADRPVVLKVTPRQGGEFRSLARLQHTNVIPLYGVYDFPARGLRALCQPHLGGASLARVLELLRPIPPIQRTGAALIDALDHASTPLDVPACGGPRSLLAHLPYAETVCWIGACLADGLHYAHERGLLHLDVKPSNVLLAADAQPLLLDFHLALPPVPAGSTPEGLGVTPGYESPEQRAAYDAACAGNPVPAAVDHRSDVYSLGRLLYVALGGEGDRSAHQLRRANPLVSPGLADVVARCLAADPARRYPDAASLAADLRRHLSAQPLRGVPNRSLFERWQKWRRRQPHGLLWAALVLALTAAPALLFGAALDCVRDGREALHDGQEQMRRRQYPEAERTLSRGKERVRLVPGSGSLAADLDAWHQRARRAAATERLHALCERLRLNAGADELPKRERRLLDEQCRDVWESRRLITDRTAPLDQADEERACANLIDLALFWAAVKRPLAPDGEARRLLDEAESLCGGRTQEGAPPAFRRHVMRGRELLKSGRLDDAATELRRAAELRPQDFWAHFYGGVCAHRRGRHTEAAHSFGVAIALAPALPEAHYNRGLANAAAGDGTAARRDYDRALALAPGLAAAALNRGVLNYQEGRHGEAIADLERSLRDGADPTAAHYNLALVHLALRDQAAARRHLDNALSHNPGHADARSLRDRLGAGR